MASKPKPFKYDSTTGYIIRYHGCGNTKFYDSSGTSKEFMEILSAFRKECARDCNMNPDDVILEIYMFDRYVKGASRVTWDWNAEDSE